MSLLLNVWQIIGKGKKSNQHDIIKEIQQGLWKPGMIKDTWLLYLKETLVSGRLKTHPSSRHPLNSFRDHFSAVWVIRGNPRSATFGRTHRKNKTGHLWQWKWWIKFFKRHMKRMFWRSISFLHSSWSKIKLFLTIYFFINSSTNVESPLCPICSVFLENFIE